MSMFNTFWYLVNTRQRVIYGSCEIAGSSAALFNAVQHSRRSGVQFKLSLVGCEEWKTVPPPLGLLDEINFEFDLQLSLVTRPVKPHKE